MSREERSTLFVFPPEVARRREVGNLPCPHPLPNQTPRKQLNAQAISLVPAGAFLDPEDPIYKAMVAAAASGQGATAGASGAGGLAGIAGRAGDRRLHHALHDPHAAIKSDHRRELARSESPPPSSLSTAPAAPGTAAGAMAAAAAAAGGSTGAAGKQMGGLHDNALHAHAQGPVGCPYSLCKHINIPTSIAPCHSSSRDRCAAHFWCRWAGAAEQGSAHQPVRG